MFQIVDWYAAVSVVFIAVFEIFSLAWIYGIFISFTTFFKMANKIGFLFSISNESILFKKQAILSVINEN